MKKELYSDIDSTKDNNYVKHKLRKNDKNYI